MPKPLFFSLFIQNFVYMIYKIRNSNSILSVTFDESFTLFYHFMPIRKAQKKAFPGKKTEECEEIRNQNAIFSRSHASRLSMATTSCCMVSRSRTVTLPVASVSKSTQMQYGVPISS